MSTTSILKWNDINLIADLLFIPILGSLSVIILFSPRSEAWFQRNVRNNCSRRIIQILVLFLILYLADRLMSWYRARLVQEKL